jgi:arylformamidase
MMKFHDITLTMFPGMTVWPGDPPFILEQIESMDAGAHVNVSRLSGSVHTGTHVDAPHHFLNNGQTVESLPLEVLIGPARVIQIPDKASLISAEVLERANVPAKTLRLLVKTRNSQLWQDGRNEFDKDFVAVSPDGASWLVEHGIRLVGVDYLSVAPFKASDLPHQTLLRAGVVILEGLDLNSVEPGSYSLYCLPLKLAGSDGAPARAILVD